MTGVQTCALPIYITLDYSTEQVHRKAKQMARRICALRPMEDEDEIAGMIANRYFIIKAMQKTEPQEKHNCKDPATCPLFHPACPTCGSAQCEQGCIHQWHKVCPRCCDTYKHDKCPFSCDHFQHKACTDCIEEGRVCQICKRNDCDTGCEHLLTASSGERARLEGLLLGRP